MMGVTIGTTQVYWDTMSIINNTLKLEFTQNKKSNTHLVCKSVAMVKTLTAQRTESENPAGDLMSKVLPGSTQ